MRGFLEMTKKGAFGSRVCAAAGEVLESLKGGAPCPTK